MSQHRKAALVTGSATGIGRAVAVRLAQQGLAVAINYSRSEAEALETLEAVRRHDVPGIVCRANVGDDRAVREMVSRCRDEWGGLDVLVNNAATTRFIEHADVDALTDEVWDEILGVNLKGTFYCSRAALSMLQERSGSIVNVTSIAGLHGNGSSIPYAASKAAVNCMTMSLARAFAPKVRVNAVAPGAVLTRWLADHQGMVERYAAAAPMRRAATPDDVADAVLFLSLGNTLITGQVIVVDGGFTI